MYFTIYCIFIYDRFIFCRSLDVPDGDILLHAGDFTSYGNKEHAEDFNAWLGELPHKHKIVINGNHESNSMWKDKVKSIVFNAVYLVDETVRIEVRDRQLCIHGTDFYWPMNADCPNPAYKLIPLDVDILMSHGPVGGHVDGSRGCDYLATCVNDIASRRICQRKEKERSSAQGGSIIDTGLKLVACGHIHMAHGVQHDRASGVCYVNASNCGPTRKCVNSPVVVYI